MLTEFVLFNEMIIHSSDSNAVVVVLQLNGCGTDAAFVFGRIALK